MENIPAKELKLKATSRLYQCLCESVMSLTIRVAMEDIVKSGVNMVAVVVKQT